MTDENETTNAPEPQGADVVGGKLYIQLTAWGSTNETMRVVGAGTDLTAPVAYIFWLKAERDRIRSKTGREAFICKRTERTAYAEYALFVDMVRPGTSRAEVFTREEIAAMAVEE